MKLTGSIGFRDIEFGVWVLQADDGRLYELAGGDRGLKQEGRRVELEGRVEQGMASAAMVGPIFRVERYTWL